MALVDDLNSDAANASVKLLPLWKADTLQARMIAFWEAVSDDFPDANAQSRPISNWIATIGSFAPTIQDFVNGDPTHTSVGMGSITTYRQSVDYIYRMFKLAAVLLTAGLITNAQGTALHVTYLAEFP